MYYTEEQISQANQVDLLQIAVRETYLKETVRGVEWSGACPKCGGVDRFSVRLKGTYLWLCRNCTDGGYRNPIQYQMIIHNHTFPKSIEINLNSEFTRSIKIQPKPEPKKAPYWFGKSVAWYESQFDSNDYFWQSYRNLPPKLIDKFHLRVGVLPLSQCKHRRLVIPVFENDKLVNIRGRQFECDCTDERGKPLKWTASGGWSLDKLPLFNETSVQRGSTVILTESPIEPVQIEFKRQMLQKVLWKQNRLKAKNIVGVATYSTSYWRDEWLEWLKHAETIVIAYDNDLAGNGGGKKGVEVNEWRKSQGLPQIKPRGVKLYERLKNDLPVMLFNWSGYDFKMDFGKLLK